MIANKNGFINTKAVMIFLFLLVITSFYMIEIGFEIIRPLFYVLIIIISIFLPHDKVLYLIMFISPINRVYMLPNISLTLVPILISIFLIKVAIREKRIRLNILLAFIILLTSSLISSFVNNLGFTDVIYYFVFLLFSYFLHSIITKKIFIRLSKFYIAGILLSSFGGMIFTNLANIVQNYRFAEFGFYRYMGLLYDSTEFAQKLVVGMGFIISLLFLIKNKNNLIYIFALFIMSYFLVLAGTRSVVLSVILVILLLIIFVKNEYAKSKIYPLVLFSLVPLIIISAVLVTYKIFDFRTGAGEVFITDRIEIWQFYISQLKNSNIMLFGIGGGNISNFALANNYFSVHNGYIEILVEFGLLGIIVLIVLLSNILFTKNRKMQSFYSYVPLLCYLLTLFTLGITRSEMFFILIGISNLNYLKNHNNEEK